jgi:anti-sigma regulatory factor (Ser/Thr protein kinase)
MAMETEYAQVQTEVMDRLVLRGDLSETCRLSEWVQSLAARYCISDELEFSIHLCLEEAVSNIIRHGYPPGTIKPVTVEFTRPREGGLIFTVEDSARPFNPVLEPVMLALDTSGELAIGGRGVRLLRAFAHTLEYDRTATGNRLRIGFKDPPMQALMSTRTVSQP